MDLTYKIINMNKEETIYYGTLRKNNKFERYGDTSTIKIFSYEEALKYINRHQPPTGEVYLMILA